MQDRRYSGLHLVSSPRLIRIWYATWNTMSCSWLHGELVIYRKVVAKITFFSSPIQFYYTRDRTVAWAWSCDRSVIWLPNWRIYSQLLDKWHYPESKGNGDKQLPKLVFGKIMTWDIFFTCRDTDAVGARTCLKNQNQNNLIKGLWRRLWIAVSIPHELENAFSQDTTLLAVSTPDDHWRSMYTAYYVSRTSIWPTQMFSFQGLPLSDFRLTIFHCLMCTICANTCSKFEENQNIFI